MNQCIYSSTCLNQDKCYRCFEYHLLKQAKQKKENKITSFLEKEKKTGISNDSWKDLEQKVADSLNQIPTIRDAKRSIASGSLWFQKGDIVDTILHPECKERTGKELKSGEKSISIKKEWLEKAFQECQFNHKTMCLPFRFKEDKHIYTIFRHEDIAELITLMKSYIQDNERKEMEIKVLKQELERSKQL